MTWKIFFLKNHTQNVCDWESFPRPFSKKLKFGNSGSIV